MSNTPSKKPYGYVLTLKLIEHAAYELAQLNRNKAFLVFCIIASYAGQDGTCYPSITKIAKKLNISRQAVTQHVNFLKENRYLFVTYPRDKANDKGTNLYRLNYKKLDSLPESSLACREAQDNKLPLPASSLPCAKKPEKKPEKEKRTPGWFRKTKQRYNAFFQSIEREEKMGISDTDIEELERIRHIALREMPAGKRTEISLAIEREAKGIKDSSEQLAFIKERYKEIAESDNKPQTL